MKSMRCARDARLLGRVGGGVALGPVLDGCRPRGRSGHRAVAHRLDWCRACAWPALQTASGSLSPAITESQMRRSVKNSVALLVATLTTAAASAAVAPSAMAISSDYCGYGRAAGEPFCFEGSGYRGWRYHQAATGNMGVLVKLCVRAYGSHGAYRVNECDPRTGSFYAADAYCSAEPTTNSSVGWTGSGTVTLYGHADSRTDACRLGTPTTSVFPDVVADRFRDPGSAGQAGVLPSTARAVGSGQGAVLFTLVGDEERCIVRVEKRPPGAGRAPRPSSWPKLGASSW